MSVSPATSTVFESLLARLDRALTGSGIPYMVVGGQAVLVYGEPRLTRDIDLTLGIGPEEFGRVLGVCRKTGLSPLVENPDSFVPETMVLPAQEPETGIRVDFIFSMTGYERQAISRSRTVRLGGADVHFAGMEDLVVHKLVAGRPRDLEDARMVLARNPGYDRRYIEHWLGEFSRVLDRDLLTVFADIVRPG